MAQLKPVRYTQHITESSTLQGILIEFQLPYLARYCSAHHTSRLCPGMTRRPADIHLKSQDLCVRRTDPLKLANKLRSEFHEKFEVHVRVLEAPGEYGVR